METAVQRVSELTNSAEKAREAGELAGTYQEAVVELSRIRREALDDLIEQGLTHGEIAEKIGTTRARVSQLLSTGPRTERAFLGAGTLTVALGGKQEAPKDSGDPGSVVATEDLQAFEALSELARSVKLTAESELVMPPGLIDLNRDNLVVICGPRLSPMINQILASDPHLSFDKDDMGWFLHDHVTGSTYRSPMNDGNPEDYAYIGRLPRPDGKGTFLYIAGIHAVGAAGVIHFLEGHMKDAYKQVRNRRFSTLIHCRFDPASNKVIESERVTPYYRPEAAA